MPDTMISTITDAPVTVPLKTLLRTYHNAHRDFCKALKKVDVIDDSTVAPELLAAKDAAEEQYSQARDKLIEAPVVGFDDIVTKLRFYFEVGGFPKMFDNPSDLGAQIVKNILRDIDRPRPLGPSLRVERNATEEDVDLLRQQGRRWPQQNGSGASDVWRAADDIDIATHGALAAFQLVFGVLEDVSSVAQDLKDTDEGNLLGHVDQLYYLVGDLHSRNKTVRERGSIIATLAAQVKRGDIPAADAAPTDGNTETSTQIHGTTSEPPTVINGAGNSPSAKTAKSAAAPVLEAFTPGAFVETVTAAVLPLMDEEDGAALCDGKTRADVREALLPLFGHYTVEDAVYAHQLLYNSTVHWDEPETAGEDPRAHAIYEAREILVHFICNGTSSSPACAAARATFSQEKDGDGDELPDTLYSSLHFRISHDISNLRASKFTGERFADTFWASDLEQERRDLPWTKH